ncbi:MAG: hypothetical protein AAFP88_03080 [Bacteroidota bacterium]
MCLYRDTTYDALKSVPSGTNMAHDRRICSGTIIMTQLDETPNHLTLGEERSMPSGKPGLHKEEGGDSTDRRLNVRFTEGGWKDVNYLATYAGNSKAEAVRRAVRTERFFRKLRDQEVRIFVEDKGSESLRELIFQD